MPIIKKPDYTIFASEAKNGELSAFPDLLRGWGVTIDQTAGKPPMEWFNTLQKRTDEWLTYLSQRGISEWDNMLDYPKNAVVQSGGNFYVSITENKSKSPDKSQSDWKPMADALNIKIQDATLTSKGIVQLSSAINSTSEVLAATPKAVRAVDVASLKIANNLSEIKDAGLVAVAQTLLNLGLGEGSALPVGVPVPWPSATPPTGWLKCNGAAFTASQYPKLALAYPALRLPDLRGEFIRGWDDTRGVNPGRKLLSPEGDAFLDHDHEIITRGPGEGNFVSPLNEQGVTSDGDNYLIGAGIYRTYKASRSGDYRTASETRPRNVAFNYIVRAV